MLRTEIEERIIAPEGRDMIQDKMETFDVFGVGPAGPPPVGKIPMINE